MSNVLQGLLTDYVRLMEKEHPTAARLVQAYANSELQQIKANAEDTDQRVPRPAAED